GRIRAQELRKQEGVRKMLGALAPAQTEEQRIAAARKRLLDDKNKPPKPGNTAGLSGELSEEEKKAIADRAEAEERKRLQRIQSAYQAYGNVLEGITGKIRAFSE